MSTPIEERRELERARYVKCYQHPDYRMKRWRHILISRWMDEQTGWLSLDVGCGRGEGLAIAEQYGFKPKGVEIVPDLCDGERVLQIDGAHSLPFGDEEFHVLTCNDVLEHVIEEDIPAVFAEMRRVLKPKGKALLGISQKPQPLHITVKDTDWWELRLRAAFGEDVGIRLRYADEIPTIKLPYVFLEVSV
jgi:ubiquinone/menaquinone biosynthesis C-methylase UbiE